MVIWFAVLLYSRFTCGPCDNFCYLGHTKKNPHDDDDDDDDELVFISHCYHKVIRVNFFETQCKYIAAQAFYKTNIHAPWTVLRTALFSVIIAPVGWIAIGVLGA